MLQILGKHIFLISVKFLSISKYSFCSLVPSHSWPMFQYIKNWRFLDEIDMKMKIRWKISYENCWIAAETFLRLLSSTSIGSIVDIEKCLYYYCSGYRFRKHMNWLIFNHVKVKNRLDINIWLQVTLILIDTLLKISDIKW